MERGCVADQPQQLGKCCDWLSAQSRSGSWGGRALHKIVFISNQS
jgi:hypothetical protein